MNVTPREEYVPLTPHQLQVLLALALRPQHGYGLIQQSAADSSGVVSLGRGAIYNTLKGLEQWGLIAEDLYAVTVGPGKPSRVYELTATGRTVLEWEVGRMRMVVHLGYERLGKPKKELESSFSLGLRRNIRRRG